MEAWQLLGSLDTYSLVLLFWFMLVLEVPRYCFGAIIVGFDALWRDPPSIARHNTMISVLLVGHNEAHALQRCIQSLMQQSVTLPRSQMQIVVVDDGSTDQMFAIARRLHAQGLVDDVLHVAVRGGKSAAINLGLTACRGEIVVLQDIDTTLDIDALALLLPYFTDPRVGGVGGDLGVANPAASLVTRHQQIEYLMSITLGRRIGDILGTLSIVSGAFGAFRRSALIGVGGHDTEVGEDADLTMKLRRAGWRIRFAPEARALTKVPETMPALIAQRLRWDRSSVTIWLRKFRGIFNPLHAIFRLRDVLALLDMLLFQITLTLLFPVYVLWLWLNVGAFTLPLLVATLLGYLALDLLALLTAACLVDDTLRTVRLLVYLPVYVAVRTSVLGPVRLLAILQEFFLRSSYRDPYVPARVMHQVERV
jgi:cellulose synthase/poly-beta-1,6-N-acetylglucosamine synthase-like glycosyltransferase